MPFPHDDDEMLRELDSRADSTNFVYSSPITYSPFPVLDVPLPVSPPLTEAGDDTFVTLTGWPSSFLTYMGHEYPGLVDMSPDGSDSTQTITLGSSFLPYPPPSGQDPNRLAILT